MSLRGREDLSSSQPRGFTLIEIMFVIGLWAVIAGIAIPQVLVAVDRQKAWAAARYLAARRSHDGLQLAVKITGATGRTRLLRYVPHTREWVGSF
jgi:prepilin-type N-terminal cleavage/methylation domain-containing protein